MEPEKIEARRRSRERFLEAAEDELFELLDTAAFHPYLLISPTAVAERAGLSKAMLYNLWPLLPEDEQGPEVDRLQRFRNDLAARICAQNYDNDLVNEAASVVVETATTFSELVRDLAVFEYKRNTTDIGERRARLFVLTEASTPPAPGALADELCKINTAENANNVRTFETLFALFNRRPVAPFSYSDLAFMVSAIVDGFVLRSLHPPEEVQIENREWQGSAEWNLMAIAIDTMLASLTEEIPAEERSAD